MRTRSFVSSALVCASFLVMVAGVQAADEKPDGTLRLTAKAVGLGVGVSWGEGSLTYKGKTHSVAVDGLTAGTVGASQIEASGEVFHLKKLADFDGNYTAVTAGGSAGGGGGALIMENQNGVKVKLVGTSQGVSLTAGVSGVKLSIKK